MTGSMTERQIREDERRRIGALLREAADEDDGRSAQAMALLRQLAAGLCMSDEELLHVGLMQIAEDVIAEGMADGVLEGVPGAPARGGRVAGSGGTAPGEVCGDCELPILKHETKVAADGGSVHAYCGDGPHAAQRDAIHVQVSVPVKLHPESKLLVRHFAEALGEKLRRAELKYGYAAGWAHNDWEQECRADLMRHLAKGDPLDVAIFCAFLWSHGWSTAGTVAPPPSKDD